MTINRAIRKLLINNLKESSYIQVAKKYNDFFAYIKEKSLTKSQLEIGIVDCNLPLIYISQPPRCGGTFARNLLDGHPDLHAYPYEISWERNGFHWENDLSHNDRVFRQLKDQWISHAINHGIDKQIPFQFSQRLQKMIFRQAEPKSVRDILGAYLTSFFNAWINYEGKGTEKKYCAAFCPWTRIDKESVERFFKLYPDGYRIHIIRNPYAWWASEKNYNQRYDKKLADYLYPHWIESTRAGIELADQFKRRYILLNYETLVENTKESMQSLCQKLNIRFHENLLVPMLNGTPRISNSSHGNKSKGISIASLEKWRDVLTKQEIDLIKMDAGELYAQAKQISIN